MESAGRRGGWRRRRSFGVRRGKSCGDYLIHLFKPDPICPHLPLTPSALTLLKAARIGEAAGLRYVYAGNLPGRVWKYENTYCPTCKDHLIARFGFLVTANRLTPDGTCPSCHTKIPGMWS